ncbi:Dioxygenase cnsJ [Penicillium cf. viridicatum]|uniref:Dioxygenase cnsJ n=1 Tax=Penicillium cf. viridicatum TaxID=2972119 RepID=A0A9W9M8L1_9EURO|nr:Dioxygenase cnsJ [Penicillium cf. viridicatum]
MLSERHRLPEVDLRDHEKVEDSIARVVEAMQISGACIVRTMFTEAMANQVREDLEKHVIAAGNFGEGSGTTSVVTGLLKKSNDYAVGMVGHEVFQKVVDYFLNFFWHERHCDHQATTRQHPWCLCAPRAAPQPLHRDDVDRANVQSAVEKYVLGRDTNVTMLVALDKTTHANGATRVIPGSHLWDYNRPIPSTDDGSLLDAELSPGDSLFILGSVIHGAGGNSTDSARAQTAIFATRGRLRQMENQFLACDMETVREFPLWLQRFMGYSIGQPATGWVSKKDPLLVVSLESEAVEELWDESFTKFHF